MSGGKFNFYIINYIYIKKNYLYLIGEEGGMGGLGGMGGMGG